jgi:uncharacterized protein YyaL (SSP411 family)
MAARLTREEALAFVERMRLMGERPAPLTDDEALTQLSGLMASAYSLGWADDLRDEDDRVRELWVRLKTHGP